MIQILIDFDETINKVIKTTVLNNDGTQIKTKKKKIDNSKPLINVDDNKLILSQSAVDMLNAEAGNRIAINYDNISNTETIPLIGLSEVFADPESGNKLTKSNTISFKGLQRTTLLIYGSSFLIEPYKNKRFKLIPVIDPDSLVDDEFTNTIEDINNVEISDLDMEIALLNEDLPF